MDIGQLKVDQLLQSPLSQEEIARAMRFHFKRDGNLFAGTRRSLRHVLSKYLPFCPEHINFDYGENGKPEVVNSQNKVGLRFNIAHSGSFAIIGVTQNRRIGVDIEHHHTADFLEIARRYFSECEYRELSTLPGEELAWNFYACWTRKEAFLKALGVGIGTMLTDVSITARYCVPPRLLEFRPHRSELHRWSLQDIPVPRDYSAAIALEGESADVQYLSFKADR